MADMTSPVPSAPLLDVRDLGIAFRSGAGMVQVTRDVTFAIAPGETVGLVGESGCGKTVTGLALMGLLPSATSHITGSVQLEGENLIGMPARQLQRRRGAKISMIFQEPMSALDPVFTIGQQISETLRAHRSVSAKEARERGIEALARVGIPEPALRFDAYPHQLSGGMRQRAMIAIAIVCEPRLLIADEPTTALDVTVQAQIVDVLGDLCARLGMAMLFITHDLGLVAQTCSRLVTMYAGEVIEQGRIDDMLVRPRHPYTSGLLRSLPALAARKTKLPAIPGRVPMRGEMPDGCRFRPRCDFALPPCEAPQPLDPVPPVGQVRCCRNDELELKGVLS
ncbi:peptide/nickel transport system ATP-binding protein [Ancylobacter aquaticus]|uniref:Peptide/nickel transport system ATP-binding protein n=1 Tax=Ancylobacter aquaticus TaxID=100 RepID=A0A4R1IC06_ANCAQ|nr:ABC transporter ATP-binding protein [Ancylobacter aquaticus]TCK28032.1 peptide/nickel transport system ATP-binding protein [Ancylobacter aquaticus]